MTASIARLLQAGQNSLEEIGTIQVDHVDVPAQRLAEDLCRVMLGMDHDFDAQLAAGSYEFSVQIRRANLDNTGTELFMSIHNIVSAAHVHL